MPRHFSASVCKVALAIVVCSLSGAVTAAEPESDAPKPLNLGGFEKSLPMAIGGGITVGVLLLGFFILNAQKPQAPAPPRQEADFDALPSHVVGSPNPLRYLVGPVLFLALLAVAVPLGYSIWKVMPDGRSMVTPPKLEPLAFPGANGVDPIDLSKMKMAPLPEPPQFKFQPTPPPPIQVPTISPRRR